MIPLSYRCISEEICLDGADESSGKGSLTIRQSTVISAEDIFFNPSDAKCPKSEQICCKNLLEDPRQDCSQIPGHMWVF